MRSYLQDGRLKIDNNLAENAIRPIALSRKNFLFCGNHEAAKNTAVICSLLSTCKARGVNPREWLNDTIAKLPYALEAKSRDELVKLLPGMAHSNNISITKWGCPKSRIAPFAIVYFGKKQYLTVATNKHYSNG